MGEPGFWDDAEAAAKVGAEHARLTRRLERYRSVAADVADLETLAELAEDDEELARELAGQLRSVEERLLELEEERLFSGPYDAGDAIVTMRAMTHEPTSRSSSRATRPPML